MEKTKLLQKTKMFEIKVGNNENVQNTSFGKI